jgi:hypothetical protein
MNRRRFLKSMGIAAGGAALLTSPWMRRRGNAAAFGEFPAGAESVKLPDGVKAKRVLEIFLYGGLSQWETLYLVQDYGRPTDPEYPNTQYYALPSSTAAAIADCGVPAGPIGRAFGMDADGAAVELGPFAHRLWSRPDITGRMRLIVQRHNLEPHEAAVPQALTGKPVGQPSAAGLGTHVQRYFLESGLAPERASPWSYVFSSGGISSDNVAAAAATGSHPGAARPLLIKTDSASTLNTLLTRPTVGGDRAAYDDVSRAYLAQYNQRLTWPGQGRVRSPRVDDLAVAFNTTTRVDAIAGVLDSDFLAQVPGTACGVTRSRDIPHMGLEAARHLLTHPTEAARYVCLSDIGLEEASGGGGYDTHSGNAYSTSMNFDNVLQGLLAIMNGPGETDPNKLSLDDTMIILNTEFGRTPWNQGGGNGRNHHPYGYVTAFIGGPINTAQAGIHGAIGRDGRATTWATPGENRIAALLALGIWPFSPEGFGVSDVRGADTEVHAASSAINAVLGIQL